ncbi:MULTISPECIES: EF-hand domain-containing protein [Moorena]|uniref:5'-nucleotidase/2',3'-cyclic phosphodiesterase family esterase n=1 Tax=Moorena producens 3L TaxID=489825 RepID=F4XUT3_9CYAN|nr:MULTISPECIES: EF-hand domain-containing protein [Moorena]EGJ31636.1 5'-nucleotidase/2',3'-cyclic phosphodiesterase family esterase [Moorena producens 3L]NEP33935.1 bifunctional metallophosphatase/5'-nucleotidase [Moorena sp. SIO3B2]NEP68980.1 bifunctional metallophosphatase/5'-nucleotidase [Moorena sp. SIO3A5]NEQ06101.1 bifunctional metallophosphatase/5'-nucleotidase [Moorena sp. SIO4E2]OLT66024.1 bifunctional metallophosphatase/5'-nucleotidase [Moorena producens 3L]
MTTPRLYLPKPREAVGNYLRIISINDVYDIKNYPYVETVIKSLKETSEDAVVIACLSGDFLSPCLITSLDGGKAMLDVLKVVNIDYICFGNHEFDVSLDVLGERFKTYEGKCLNSNILDLPIVDASGQPLPKYEIVEVGSHRVAFAGFCTNNTDIFRPGTNLTIQPIFDALKETWSKCSNDATMLIPLTHQTIAEDRELATEIQQDHQLSGKVPVIVGGHEHEIYIEKIERSLIVKAGADATNVVVVDVWWDASEQCHSAVHLLPASHFDADPNAQMFVEITQNFLGSLMDVEIFDVKESMSSKRTRFQPEKVASTLCSYIKKSLNNVDLVMLQGGCVRGKRDYEKGAGFTYGDLLEELPFDTEIALIQVPGYVLQEAITETRSTPDREAPNFLHADFDVVVEDYPSLKIVSINHTPFDPQKMYTLGIYQFLLTGLNEIKPLLDYVKANGGAPPLEQCLPGKNLIMESSMKDAWRVLINYEQWDADGDGEITREELKQGVKNAFAFLDQNQDGYISPPELRAALAERTGRTQKGLISLMFEVLDVDKDGMVSMDELASLAM